MHQVNMIIQTTLLCGIRAGFQPFS